MRTAIQRADKYSQKLDGDVQKNRIDAQKATMITNASATFADWAAFDTDVKSTLVGSAGVTTIQIAPYMAYARQVKKIALKHGTGTMATGEAQLKYDTALARGLTEAVLVALAALVGITVTS
jgi:hypothetical protein